MKTTNALRAAFIVATLFAGCTSTGGSSPDGSTSWLRSCEVNATCSAGFECRCGLCTKACSGAGSCSALGANATCADRAALTGACTDLPATGGICLAACGDSTDCPSLSRCASGVCVPDVAARPTLDASAGAGGSAGVDSSGGSGGSGGSRSRDGGIFAPDAGDASARATPDGAPSSGSGGDAGSAFRVVSVSPESGASDAATNAAITATFSASVLPSSVSAVFELDGPVDSIAGDVTASDASATFTPHQALPLACTATATLGASVADLGGHALGAPYTWSFTTADGSWQSPQSVGGAGYVDNGLFGDPPRFFLAGDGSAFTAWSAYDSTSSHVYLNASRYTPAGGWAPYLQFDEFEKKAMYGGATPALAVSDNGEAMVAWRDGSAADGGISYVLMSMRYSSGWEAPVRLEGPVTATAPISFSLGADAHGNFVAAWLELSSRTGDVRMTRYTRGVGWGAVEAPSPPGPDGGAHPVSFGLSVSTAASGNALVLWAEGANYTGPRGLAAERFDPATGWSGKEMLTENVPGQFGGSNPSGAVGDDGSAAAAWIQGDPSNQRSHTLVRTFSTAWSAPYDLAGTDSGGYSGPQIATDARGAFIATWTDADPEGDQAYASRLTPGESWSPKTLLNAPEGLPDGGATSLTELFPQVVMSRTGDALIGLTQWNRSVNTYTVDVVTFSPSTGWAAQTRLDTQGYGYGTPLIDGCGNASLYWLQRGTNAVMSARHVHGGTWTTTTLGTTNSSGTNAGTLAASVGPSGETIVGWRAPDDHATLASVLR